MKKISGMTGLFFALVLLCVALWALLHELRHYHYRDIVQAVHAIPGPHILLALGLTVLDYLILTGYDTLAFRYIGQKNSYREIAPASFLAYSVSNNLGFSLFSGTAVRYRFYSALGISGLDISKIVAFCSLTFWTGLASAGGLSFLLSPPPSSGILHDQIILVRPLGAVLLSLPAAYLLLCLWKRIPVRFKGFEFSLPGIKTVITQLLLGASDIALTAMVLYSLLPSGVSISYLHFLGIFNLALIIGLISHVPGGLGVFETAILLLLPPEAKGTGVVGALLVFRAVYYLLPLILASISITGVELYTRRQTVGMVARKAGGIVSFLLPHFLAVTTFLGGVVLLFSGATPTIHGRLTWLNQFLPLTVIEVTHFLSGLTGAALLILARGIQRRLDSAYHTSLLLLLLGALWALLKGFDYEEAGILMLFFLLLSSSRKQFFRRASLTSVRFSPGWVLLVGVALACAGWIGLFSYKHIEYSHDLWWRWTLFGDASRFMRAEMGIASITILFILARLFRPAPVSPALPSAEELELARTIIARTSDTRGFLALLGDKSLLLSESRQSFIMYGVTKRSWVAMGDPVGWKEDARELIWNFREMSHLHDGWAVFYQVRPENLPLYLDLGLSLVKLGEEGRVPLADFSLEGSSHKKFRQYVSAMEREGGMFEIVPADKTINLLTELKNVSDDWLKYKHTSEKRFSLGFFDRQYLCCQPVAVVRRNGRIIAFANVLHTGMKEEISVDLMRYVKDAPEGTMDYLFVKLLLWGKEEGFGHFNLGMAPLSGLENRSLAPLWNQAGALMFRHGEHFYNFQGLRHYKEKFHPVWEPRYLASPGGLALPRILTNISELISGGLLGAITR